VVALWELLELRRARGGVVGVARDRALVLLGLPVFLRRDKPAVGHCKDQYRCKREDRGDLAVVEAKKVVIVHLKLYGSYGGAGLSRAAHFVAAMLGRM
jgi:hypothetical protein